MSHLPVRPAASLVGSLSWFCASYAVSLTGYVAITAIASRALGRAEFGYFVIVTSLTTVVGQLALVGTHRAGLRDAARLRDRDPDEIRQLRRASRAVSIVTLPVAGALLGAAASALVDGYDATARIELGLAVAALTVLSGQQKLWSNYLRGLGQIRVASMLEGRSGGAAVSLTQAVLLLLGWRAAPDIGLVGFLALSAVGFLPAVVAAWLVVAEHWRRLPVQWTLAADVRVVLTRNRGFASAQLAAYVNTNLELWTAGLLLVAADTSLFSGADRLVLLLIVPMTSLQVVFSPMVARTAASDPLTTERLLRTGATVAALVTSVLWVPMLVAPRELLHLVYGDAFAAASTALVLLTVGYIANVIGGLSGIVLSMTDREGQVARLTWWAVGARAALAVPAAGLWGIEGLAASEALVSTVLSLVLWRVTRAQTGISTHVTTRPSLALARQTVG